MNSSPFLRRLKVFLRFPIFVYYTVLVRVRVEKVLEKRKEKSRPYPEVKRWRNLWTKASLKAVDVRYSFSFGEDFRLEDNMVVISNHRSFLDILLIEQLIQRLDGKTSTFVAKKELMSFPVMGRLIVLLGALFIDRSVPRDFVKLVSSVKKILKEHPHGNMFVVFPEGTRNKGKDKRSLGVFKEGFLKLSQSQNLNILPVFIEGNVENYLEDVGLPQQDIDVKVGSVIKTEGKTLSEVVELYKAQFRLP